MMRSPSILIGSEVQVKAVYNEVDRTILVKWKAASEPVACTPQDWVGFYDIVQLLCYFLLRFVEHKK